LRHLVSSFHASATNLERGTVHFAFLEGGSSMVGNGAAGALGEQARTRLLIARASGCLVAVGLDCIDAVIERAQVPGDLQVVALEDVTGAPPQYERSADLVAVLRTPSGPIGLAIEACIGVRVVSLASAPPIPTRLCDSSGAALCFVLLLDGTPYVLLEPRALQASLVRRTSRAEHDATDGQEG
jgi:hypothetical protein